MPKPPARKLYLVRMRRPENGGRVTTFAWRAETREAAEAMARKVWGEGIEILPPIARKPRA